MPTVIATNVAYSVRFDRGLRLPVNAEYSDPRIKHIADAQALAFDAIEQGDRLLKQFYEEEQAAAVDRK